MSVKQGQGTTFSTEDGGINRGGATERSSNGELAEPRTPWGFVGNYRGQGQGRGGVPFMHLKNLHIQKNIRVKRRRRIKRNLKFKRWCVTVIRSDPLTLAFAS